MGHFDDHLTVIFTITMFSQVTKKKKRQTFGHGSCRAVSAFVYVMVLRWFLFIL